MKIASDRVKIYGFQFTVRQQTIYLRSGIDRSRQAEPLSIILIATNNSVPVG